MKKSVRLGTRGSPLALIQAEDVRSKLMKVIVERRIDLTIEIIPIRTTGDWLPEHKEQAFFEMGGNKERFTKEIEDALNTETIDAAIHSMKDVSSILPPGLVIGAVLERLDPRDAFISPKARTLDELKPGAIVGTSSLRRQAQILARRPDLVVTPLRGNVETRLQKIAHGIADATLLAVAGLSRLHLEDRITSILEPSIMLPAGAQGAVGIEVRENDTFMRDLIQPLNSEISYAAIMAERAMLKVLDGSCQTPIGALARARGDKIEIEGLVAKPDGSSCLRLSHAGSVSDPARVGSELGQKLKGRVPVDFFAA